MRILIVEDDKQTARFISKGLRQEGFAVDHASDGEDGLHLVLTEPYDAAVIDIMLPKLDGLTLIDEMRRNNSEIPILILSAKNSVDDRIKGLQAGGDDYLVKPFAFSELVARRHAWHLILAEKKLAAASVRLRPILLTSLTTIAALLPTAIGTTVGSRIFQPFAITVISGLAGGILATLIIIPTIAMMRCFDEKTNQ